MDSVLCHHGIKGQKWGVRRFQNPDGTWTSAGKERYGDSDGETSKTPKSSGNTKKVAVGVATGAAIVAGTVLTAYLVKKYGGKNVADIADKASAGKEVFQEILKSTPVATTPVSQIPTPKVEPKQVLEKAVKAASTTAAQASQISAPRVSVSKPSSEIPPAFNFESLMRQNDDLLKKMLAELA
ncbi:MAG: hypothetical protein NC489_41815 [Ruminococcus flavefaciens]|nr:hypothetical protein [Ruminococcus flavefaciens]